MAVTLGAAGKVCTGFSLPYVAEYTATAGSITYSNGRLLARGVDVSLEPDEPSDNDFYADNQKAETAPGRFTSGSCNLTVDGLLVASEQMIMGLPEAGEDGWIAQGDTMNPIFCGLGYIARYMSGGVECYTPTILPKVKFNLVQSAAATQEDEIDWQTQSLTARIFRADNANHDWKWLGSDFATEAEAEAALKTKLGITGE